ncbi:MAG: AAA family ATPase, partial [Micromonosporaceae bacterium]
EAKSNTEPVDGAELVRLEHLRELLPPERVAAEPTLLLFSRTGFTRELLSAAKQRPDVQLADLNRLYHGD